MEGDRPTPPAVALPLVVEESPALAESEVADASPVDLEVVYDPTPRGPGLDREGLHAYLRLIYANTPLDELERTAWQLMQTSNNLAAEAFKDQRASGRCNAAVSTDGFTPRAVLDRRPSCRYLSQTAVERVELADGSIALRHVEHYVREDEYPDVFRSSEELRWLEDRIESLGGKRPSGR